MFKYLNINGNYNSCLMNSEGPQIIQYYNELPSYAIVIEKMNNEYNTLREENKQLKKKIEKYKDGKIDPLYEYFPFIFMTIILTEITIITIYI